MSTALPGFEHFDPSRRFRVTGAFVATAGAIGLTSLARLDIHPNPLFHPHGYCYLWEPGLVGVHVVSDSLIGLSYLAISMTLAYLVARARRGIPFGWMFLAFGAFIIACGGTHVMEVLTLWKPLFWTSADVKLVTAVASVGTAVALPPLVPRILTLLEAAQLSESRRLALERANAELERRVVERTSELADALVREQDLRERAETANRVKDEFLGLVSHELRTPMNAILGWSSMLARPGVASDLHVKGIDAIARNARAQAHLIDDLLDTSRVTAGKLRISRDPVRLAGIVEDAIETIKPMAEAKRVSVRAENSARGAYMRGDAHRTQQIIWNVLSNAVKFTPPGGRVDVSVTDTSTHVSVAVKDSGVGIDPAFLPHVFERFSQADSSPTRSHSGLGLGLALVKYLVELHGGEVSAASEGVGHGSTFTVTFPLLTEHAATAELTHGEDDVPNLRDLRVLVVDDDHETLEMLAAGLVSFGARVIPVSSAKMARERVAMDAPDVIVSDLAMPGEDGFDLFAELRRTGVVVPVIALTAHVRDDAKMRVLGAGFSEFVAKPATPLEVARALSRAVRV